MARRRKSAEVGDSLDLLLDTICNTFGGVLFMAMLICLLSGGPARPKPIDAQSAARSQLATLAAADRRERDEFDARAARDRAEADGRAADADAARVAASLGWTDAHAASVAASLADRAARVHEALATRDVIAALTRDAAAGQAALARARAERDARRAEVDAARKAADAERDRNRVTLRVPTARESKRRQAVAFVSGGRLYAGVYPSPRFQGNVPVFRGLSAGGDDKSMRPQNLPGALGSPGVATPAGADAALVAQGLATLDADACYVVFAVWPDSHEAFRLLRDAAAKRGLSYGLLLMGEGEAVSFGASTGYEQ